MPAKKTKPTPRFDTAKAAVRGHPWWSIGTIAAVVSIIAVFGPWLSGWWGGWVGGFQTVIAAKAEHDSTSSEDAKIRAELATEIAKLRGEIVVQAARENQRAAWNTWSVNDVKALILRNRVNECAAMEARGRLQPAEASACKQYETEFQTAAKRAETLYEAAQRTGKAN